MSETTTPPAPETTLPPVSPTVAATQPPLVAPAARNLPPTAADVAKAMSELHPATLNAALELLKATAEPVQAPNPAPAPVAVRKPKAGDDDFKYHAEWVNERGLTIAPTQAQLDENLLHDQILSSRRFPCA